MTRKANARAYAHGRGYDKAVGCRKGRTGESNCKGIAQVTLVGAGRKGLTYPGEEINDVITHEAHASWARPAGQFYVGNPSARGYMLPMQKMWRERQG